MIETNSTTVFVWSFNAESPHLWTLSTRASSTRIYPNPNLQQEIAYHEQFHLSEAHRRRGRHPRTYIGSHPRCIQRHTRPEMPTHFRHHVLGPPSVLVRLVGARKLMHDALLYGIGHILGFDFWNHSRGDGHRALAARGCGAAGARRANGKVDNFGVHPVHS